MCLLDLVCRCTSACRKLTSVSGIHTNILHAFLISSKPVHAASYLFSLIRHLSLCGSHSSEVNSFSVNQENPNILWNPNFHYRVYKSVEEQTVNHNKSLIFSEIWCILERGAANLTIFTKYTYVRNTWEMKLST